MSKVLKFTAPGLLLAFGLALSVAPTQATPAIAKKEGKTCTYCHVKAGSKDLNDAGKYYKEHKTLEGYKPK